MKMRRWKSSTRRFIGLGKKKLKGVRPVGRLLNIFKRRVPTSSDSRPSSEEEQPVPSQPPALRYDNSDLGRLPFDVKAQLVDYLDWLSLVRLRATCHYYRDLPSRQQKQRRLLEFEISLYKTRALVAAGDTHQMPVLQRANMIWSAFRKIGVPPTLLDIGSLSYFPTRINFTVIPCYGCFRVLKKANPQDDPYRLKNLAAAETLDKSEILSRRCVQCTLHNPEALVHGTRWVKSHPFAEDAGKMHVRCTKCLQIDAVSELNSKCSQSLCKRQIESGLCQVCWEEENHDWLAHKAEADATQRQLNKYTRWMDLVDTNAVYAQHPQIPEPFHAHHWTWRATDDQGAAVGRMMPTWTAEDFSSGPLCGA